MNTKKSLRLINIFITAFVLVMVPFLNGCGESDAKVYKTIESHDGEDYRTFVANEGIPHFSFEYSISGVADLFSRSLHRLWRNLDLV